MVHEQIVIVLLCTALALQVGCLVWLRTRLTEMGKAGRGSTQASQQAPDPEGMKALKVIRRGLDAQEASNQTFHRVIRAMRNSELGRLAGIADELNIRSGEVKEFKKGQQGAVVKRLLSEVVRIHQDFSACSNDDREGETKQELYRDAAELIEDHLEAVGVTRRSPKTGSPYPKDPLSSDKPEVVRTQRAEDDWLIKSVEEPAWVFEEGDKVMVLSPARVTVFRHEAAQ